MRANNPLVPGAQMISVRELVEKRDAVQNANRLSRLVYREERSAAAHQRRIRRQWQEVTSFPAFFGAMAGMAVGGALVHYRLGYLGSSIALVAPVYLIGGLARIAISKQARDRARGSAEELRGRIRELDLPTGWRMPEGRAVLLSDEMREEGFPSLWNSARPYVQYSVELMTVVKFIAAGLEVAGFLQMGKFLNAIRGMGVLAILLTSSVKGLYDTEATGTERWIHAGLFAALVAIGGCRAYQELSGVHFGDYQLAWDCISKGEYYGYLLFKEGAAAWTLYKAWEASSKWGVAVKKRGQEGLMASVTRVDDRAGDRKKHLARARSVETQAQIRDAKAATIRGLLDLVRPGLVLLGLVDATSMVHRSLRLAEGVAGLAMIFHTRWRSSWVERKTIEEIRPNLDDYLPATEYLRRRGERSDAEILALHREVLEVEKTSDIRLLLRRCGDARSAAT